jgi:glycosyltransferase involved in cell wall biosynthesis
MVDVSVVITAHREGLIANSSLKSAQKAIEHARAAGITVEAIAMLDNADALTVEVFSEAHQIVPGISVNRVAFSDAGFARNAAANLASGKYIALLDADDFWLSDWIEKAYQAAEADTRDVVWHPEVNVYFGLPGTQHLFLHHDMEDPAFKMATLAFTNCWTSLCFARADLFRRVPYTGSDLAGGIGYEDWTWNIDVLDAGALHKIVPGTSHMIRRKMVSLLKASNDLQCIPRPNDFFRKRFAARFAEFSEPGARG